MSGQESQTPLDWYLQQKDAADIESGQIALQISEAKAKLRELERGLQNSKDHAAKLSGEFIETVLAAGGLYAAAFELGCKEDFELPRDLRRANTANFIAKQLIKLNSVLSDTSDPTPVLIIDTKSEVLTSNPSSLSYPRGSDLVRRNENWMDAELLRVPGGEKLRTKVVEERDGFKGLLRSVAGIDMPVMSTDRVWSDTKGFDHDTWLEGPFSRSVDHDELRNLNIYLEIARREAEVVIDGDFPEDTISGLFVGNEAIAHAYQRVEKIPAYKHSVQKLGELLSARGINTE